MTSTTGKASSRSPIDFGAIVDQVDLKALIADDVGEPLRGGRWACPFHGGENPNLSVNGRRWRCFVCGRSGSALDWLMLREGITIVEAARRLDPTIASKTPGKAPGRADGRSGAAGADSGPPRRQESTRAAWGDPSWQAEVDRIIVRAERTLWSKAGRPALDWLRSRGLEDHTIYRFRLGFLPDDSHSGPLEALGTDRYGRTRRIWARRGITIPWVRPGSWYSTTDDAFGDPGPRWVGCNVRRLSDEFGDPADKPKYQALAGSERGHAYPFADMAPDVPAIICEGEIDALTAWQEIGIVANAVTVGGAEQEPRLASREALDACPDWLLMFDHDANRTGDKGAARWRERNRHKCRRLWLPSGKDLNQFHASGGDVRGWLRDEWTRFGLSWPLRTPVSADDDVQTWIA